MTLGAGGSCGDGPKTIPQLEIDPMPLAFKANPLAYLLSRQVGSNLCHSLSRSVSRPLHQWCYNILAECLSVNRKRGENKSFVSLQARYIFAWEYTHFIVSIPTLSLYDMKPNESEM